MGCSMPGSLSFIISWSLLKFMSIESRILCNHLILCFLFLLMPSIFLSIRAFSSKSALHIRWPEYWSFRFSIISPKEYSGLISLRVDWLNLLAVQRTPKSLLWHQIQKHQFFGAQPFYLFYGPWSKSRLCYWKNHSFDYMNLCQQSDISAF